MRQRTWLDDPHITMRLAAINDRPIHGHGVFWIDVFINRNDNFAAGAISEEGIHRIPGFDVADFFHFNDAVLTIKQWLVECHVLHSLSLIHISEPTRQAEISYA